MKKKSESEDQKKVILQFFKFFHQSQNFSHLDLFKQIIAEKDEVTKRNGKWVIQHMIASHTRMSVIQDWINIKTSK